MTLEARKIRLVMELRQARMILNDVMEEWLQLEAEDQRDLLFRALDARFSMAEWILWAIHKATRETEEAIADSLRALVAARHADDRTGRGTALHLLAACYDSLGRGDEASRLRAAAFGKPLLDSI